MRGGNRCALCARELLRMNDMRRLGDQHSQVICSDKEACRRRAENLQRHHWGLPPLRPGERPLVDRSPHRLLNRS